MQALFFWYTDTMRPNRVIDFHTHAFPDHIAERAVPALAREGNVSAHLNGTITDLIASMDRAGIDISVVCSIATRPSQFEGILAWSRDIRSSRIIPLPSVHPADAGLPEKMRLISEEGFAGIKMHAYYQDFFLDEERLFPLYKELLQRNLLVVMHTGFDIAFPRIRRAEPERVLRVMERFPGLKLITTHLGGWDDWQQVESLLAGKPVYMDISFTATCLDDARMRTIIRNHPEDCILFGTDSPWRDQFESIEHLRSLHLPERLEAKILGENAARLLGIL